MGELLSIFEAMSYYCGWAGCSLGVGQNLSAQGREESYIHAEITPDTGRACCKACSKKIGAGGIRIHYGSRYFHLRCHKPLYKGKYHLDDKYFSFDQQAFSEENKKKLTDWIAKWNEKNDDKNVEMPKEMQEKAISVTNVAPTPETEDGSGFGILANDTNVLIFSKLEN